MNWVFILPMLSFVILAASERKLPVIAMDHRYQSSDWVINGLGFLFQGAIIPLYGYGMASLLLPGFFPHAEGMMGLSWWGAFFLNFIAVDFLYYWQHRAFHEIPFLWRFHQCHHATPRLDVWATARNTITAHFLFVYVLVNPLLGFLSGNPEAFFCGAMLTASLDLLRHTRVDVEKIPIIRRWVKILSFLFVMPKAHHWHHDASFPFTNYGANLILWDRLFNTVNPNRQYPTSYQILQAPGPFTQLFYPFDCIGKRHPRLTKK